MQVTLPGPPDQQEAASAAACSGWRGRRLSNVAANQTAHDHVADLELGCRKRLRSEKRVPARLSFRGHGRRRQRHDAERLADVPMK